ncbi:MAG TPA: isoaspartyl peptidase/L-asparaginase [Saprospiraceae bacterium]|nr:isoaspartyl peptidase/L-asparaginase [Saprospiraceae bacterium]
MITFTPIIKPYMSRKNKFAIALHGGAGTILRSHMTPQKEARYKKALNQALEKAYQILDRGGSAMDAVEAAVMSLEDSPLFNAGKGSVFTSTGKQEMDASIMDGKTLDAGAVAMVQRIKNPVRLARLVMDRSEHVFLAGKGAEDFAFKQGLEKMDPGYFFVKERYEQLQKAKTENQIVLDHDDRKFGTVGAVALDRNGDLAAATSTGGMTNKKFGRIGDSPLIGSGSYANNASCAVSCTGSGEFFIRTNAAFHVSALMQYGQRSLSEACDEVVHHILKTLGGDGGLIAVDHLGNIHLSFNTDGMYRAWRKSGNKAHVSIYK